MLSVAQDSRLWSKTRPLYPRSKQDQKCQAQDDKAKAKTKPKSQEILSCACYSEAYLDNNGDP